MEVDRTVSDYLLVEWMGENKFSVIPRSKIVVEQIRNEEDDILTAKPHTISCYWRKNKIYEAKVLQCGKNFFFS